MTRIDLDVEGGMLKKPEGVDRRNKAITNNAKVDIVNIMTFDYWDGKQHDMAADTVTAAQGLVDALHTLYPQRTR